eukprot:PhF_6_TR32986/c0_g2_i1/m.48588
MAVRSMLQRYNNLVRKQMKAVLPVGFEDSRVTLVHDLGRVISTTGTDEAEDVANVIRSVPAVLSAIPSDVKVPLAHRLVDSSHYEVAMKVITHDLELSQMNNTSSSKDIFRRVFEALEHNHRQLDHSAEKLDVHSVLPGFSALSYLPLEVEEYKRLYLLYGHRYFTISRNSKNISIQDVLIASHAVMRANPSFVAPLEWITTIEDHLCTESVVLGVRLQDVATLSKLFGTTWVNGMRAKGRAGKKFVDLWYGLVKRGVVRGAGGHGGTHLGTLSEEEIFSLLDVTCTVLELGDNRINPQQHSVLGTARHFLVERMVDFVDPTQLRTNDEHSTSVRKYKQMRLLGCASADSKLPKSSWRRLETICCDSETSFQDILHAFNGRITTAIVEKVSPHLLGLIAQGFDQLDVDVQDAVKARAIGLCLSHATIPTLKKNTYECLQG